MAFFASSAVFWHQQLNCSCRLNYKRIRGKKVVRDGARFSIIGQRAAAAAAGCKNEKRRRRSLSLLYKVVVVGLHFAKSCNSCKKCGKKLVCNRFNSANFREKYEM
jgi:hypothetical protein